MSNNIFTNEEKIPFELTVDELNKAVSQDISPTFANTVNENLNLVLDTSKQVEDLKTVFGEDYNLIVTCRDKISATLKREIQNYRETLNKYLLSPNLNFLLGNGCSIYAGAKTINEKTNDFDEILKDLQANLSDQNIQSLLKISKQLRPEELLSQLSEVKSFFEIIKSKDLILIKDAISEVKEKFLEKCIVPIDYANNEFHQLFLRRVVSRPGNLNKVNIFTINYDLLIERACEDLEIFVSNGFFGFHSRVFSPAAFKLDLHLDEDKPRHFAKNINLFKLHGSISWRRTNELHKNPYGLEEIQIRGDRVKSGAELNECIIYPIQTKKQHSLDLPYSELFRQFIENLHKPASALLIMGYGFLDEHINDLIANALLKPDFHLIVFLYETEEKLTDDHKFLKSLIKRSGRDSRITIFSGPFLGDFRNIVQYVMPYIKEKDFEQVLADTFKELKSKGPNG